MDMLKGARAMSAATQESLEEHVDDDGNVSVTWKKSEAVVAAIARRYYLVDLKVFNGDEKPRCLPMRIDTRVHNGSLLIRVELLGVEKIVEDAFEEACKKVSEATGIDPIRAVF
jgi:hypothetical protein